MRRIGSRVGITVALAVVVAVALAAPALAAGVFTPKSTTITFASSATTLKAGGITLTCSTFSISGFVNAAGTTIGADATGPATQVTLTGCKALGGLLTATVDPHGRWEKQGPNHIVGDTWDGDVTIGVGASALNGAASITLSTGCILTIGANQLISGGTMTDSDTNLELTDNTVAYTSNGVGLGCPAPGNANFTASGSAAFVSTPAFTIS